MVRISLLLEILAYTIAFLGYLPLLPNLEAAPRFALPAALLLGPFAARKGWRLAGPLPTIISIIFFLYYAAQFNRENIAGPAVNLLVLLLAIRLVSEKKVRHYLQIFALALFSLAGSSLFTLDMYFLVYLILLVFLIAAGLVILTFHGADENLTLSGRGMKSLLSVAFLIPFGALPLMCVFFFILPRTQYPLWNFLNAAGSRVTGFSEKVQPGAAASVGEAKRPVFRVNCIRLSPEQLYWRGTVLNTPTGNAWVRGEPPSGETGRIAKKGHVHQTIYPEPARSGYFFALNVPSRIYGVRTSLSGDFVAKSPSAATRRVKYEADSVSSDTIATKTGIDRAFYLKLPRPLPPRFAAVAMNIARSGKNDPEKLELLKRFFISSKLSYATSGLPVSADPLDEFMFNTKRGSCEFFASSFALLLRMSGVPSRLVGGYLGGAYNDLGGYYLVTEEMAHVWVEAYLGDRWVMVDPSTLAANFGKTRDGRDGGLGLRLRMFLDSCDYYWNMTVIAYDLEKQIQLAGKIDFRMRSIALPRHPGRTLFLAGTALLLLVLTAMAVKFGRLSREEKILRKFLRTVKRKYHIELLPSTGLHEMAARGNDPRVDEFVAIYSSAVYGDRRLDDEEYRRLCHLLREMA